MNDPRSPIPRSSGVLLHVTSLPGRYGVGDLGPAAHDFAATLARARQTWWQMLPLTPPAEGNSPYQSYSAFAGNPLLISPDLLRKDGLIGASELRSAKFEDGDVDFDRVIPWKAQLLVRAWEHFRDTRTPAAMGSAFRAFCREHRHWLDDYALFMAIKENYPGSWYEWPRELSVREPKELRRVRKELADSVRRHQFTQFLFFRQLGVLRSAAAAQGIRLMGDLPIFVAGDSADVWANARLFLLDQHHRPKVVAGVPPDYFSRTGQRWGNPLYDWRAMKRDGFAWWVARFRAAVAQADVVRVDHFRGFAAAWSIPASEPTAERGQWVKAPGRELLTVVRRKMGGLPFIAEDLGEITPDVEALRDDFALPGMRILQFAFGGDASNGFLPHNHRRNAIVYTGTHDNDTTVGWLASLSSRDKAFLKQYAPPATGETPAWRLVRLAWSSVAACAIVPAQDLLSLGTTSRMNVPGKATGNWGWRLRDGAVTPEIIARLKALTETYGRAAPAAVRPRGRSSAAK